MSSREVSAQECVFRCFPELWLRKTFPGVIFINTDIPENRVRMVKSLKDLQLLDETSTEIFQRNLIDRYAEALTSLIVSTIYALRSLLQTTINL